MVRLPRGGGLARNMSKRTGLRRLAWAGLFLCFAIVFGAAAPSPICAGQDSAPSKQTIERTLQQVIRDQDIQHDPPQPEDVAHSFNLNLDLGALRIPIYVLLGVGLLVVLWYVGKAALDLARPSGQKVPRAASETVTIQPLAPESAPVLPELEEILRLAREGAYEAAIHLLLLQGLRHLARLTGTVMALSLTSREILRRPDLPQGAGRDLATLVDAVEISRFGGRAAEASLFETCLASYHRLAGASPLVQSPTAARPS
jgi:hypothetical protein